MSSEFGPISVRVCWLVHDNSNKLIIDGFNYFNQSFIKFLVIIKGVPLIGLRSLLLGTSLNTFETLILL